MKDITITNLDTNKSQHSFIDGSTRSVVIVDKIAIGRGIYLPGWRWSLHAGAQTGKSSSSHTGYIVSGQMMVRSQSGEEVSVTVGEIFDVGTGHDAWVVGSEPCVAMDFGILS